MGVSDRLPAEDLDEVIAHTRNLWEHLRGERLFITGGTGFVGRWLIESLLEANDRFGLNIRAVVLSRDPDAFARRSPHLAGSKAVEMLAGDVRTFDFPGGHFDRVLHVAGETNTQLTDPDPEVYLDVMFGGTRRVLAFADQARVGSLLLVSSGAVYGRPTGGEPLSEEHLTAPDPTVRSSAYGEAKRVAELLVCDHARRTGIAARIARCFAFVGPYLPVDSGYAVGNFIGDALATGEIVIRGDGSPQRSYLYAADMASWLWTIAVAGASERPYNVGSDEAVTIADLAQIVAASCGPSVSVKILGDSQQVGAGSAYLPSVKRARAELGLSVSVPLRVAVDRAVAWQRLSVVAAPNGE